MCGLCGDAACCNYETLTTVMEAMGSLDQQPRTVFFINQGYGVPRGDTYFVQKLLRAAQRANVTIQAVDPGGLKTARGINPKTEGLRTISESTGGRAIVNHNDPETVVPAVMAETRAYYLAWIRVLGNKSDGAFHPVKVEVNRPDVEVRARSGYYDGLSESAVKAARKAPPPGTMLASMAGFLARSDVPLLATVAPFADRRGNAVLAIVLGVGPPAADDATSAVLAPQGETAEVLARLFDSDGRSFGSANMKVSLAPAEGSGDIRYELLPRLPAPSRRFELRIGLRLDNGRTGSVYTSIDVPNFANDRLSLSGLVLSATPALPSAPKDAFADLIPVVPTARREFEPDDRATAFLRVYQGRSRALQVATVTTRVVNSRDEEVARDSQHVDVASFGAARSADYRFMLPFDRLDPGEYLLSVTVAAGSESSARALRFSVRSRAATP